jgi:Protein of unknown function (DUF1566)
MTFMTITAILCASCGRMSGDIYGKKPTPIGRRAGGAPEKFLTSDSQVGFIPIYSAQASDICSPSQFRKANGVLTTGTKDCGLDTATSSRPAADCTAAGQTGCKTTSAIVAAEASLLTGANIKAGVTIGGVAGAFTGTFADCTTGGEQGCIASGAYYAGLACAVGDSNCFVPTYAVASQTLKAINYSSIDQTKMLDTLTIAGGSGTVASRGSWTLTESFPGVGYYTGVTVQPVAALIAAGSTVIGVAGSAQLAPANCSTSSAVGCVSTAPYVSADLTNLSAQNIKNGVTIAGVSGLYPSGTYPLTSDPDLSDLTNTNFNTLITSASNFEFFDSSGARITHAGSSDLVPANIASGKMIFGKTGTLTSPNAWDLRAGVSLNGVTGALKVNCRNKANLSIYDIGAGQAATVTSIAGTLHVITTTVAHGLTSQAAVRIEYSTAPTGADSITTYYAEVLDLLTLRLHTAVGLGTPVSISGAGVDVTVHKWQDGFANAWDTVDDYNNNGTGLPQTRVSGWSSDTACGGVTTEASDSSVWLDVTTSNGTAASTCSGAITNCSFKDKISGLSWSKSQGTFSWYKAVDQCGTALNTTTYAGNQTQGFNGQTGWRLPTHKELFEAYQHGIRDTQQTNFVSNFNLEFWSATTYASDLKFSLSIILSSGKAGYVSGNWFKYTANNVLCVR